MEGVEPPAAEALPPDAMTATTPTDSLLVLAYRSSPAPMRRKSGELSLGSCWPRSQAQGSQVTVQVTDTTMDIDVSPLAASRRCEPVGSVPT